MAELLLLLILLLTVGNKLVQVFCDLLADHIWPPVPISRIAQ